MLAALAPRLHLEDLSVAARFLASLPAFLRRPVAIEQARATLRARLERREENFLALVDRAVYHQAASPYRELLALAGCQYGDLERLVRREGLEGALSELYRRGVYLAVDEFKGRRPAVRGSSTIQVEPARLYNPGLAPHILGQSSGSRGPRTAVPLDLAHLRDRLVNLRLYYHARGGDDWRYALWGAPGWAVAHTLFYRHLDRRGARWFSPIDFDGPDLSPYYRWAARALRLGGAVAGVGLPRPRHVPIEDPLPLARWMADALRAGHIPHLHTYASPAVRLLRTAWEVGLDLRGAQLMLTGEPITSARMDLVRRAGAEAVADYGSTEAGGFIAYGCLAREAPDDVHFFDDLHALIQAPPDGSGSLPLPPRALLISSLCPTAPMILLNVSMGDQAQLVKRVCGCPVERLGWTTHLHTIRSFEKLTAGGAAFLNSDIVRVLEEVLPAQFGGGPTDYQLVEEISDGEPRLRLLVHPVVGPLDIQQVGEAFLTAVGGNGKGRLPVMLWRQAALLSVERREPQRTASGKIHHVHLQRGA